MDKWKSNCLFCGTSTEVTLESGEVFRCGCGAYAAVISESYVDQQKEKISEEFNLPSPHHLLFGYKTIYYRIDPLVILWCKVPSRVIQIT